jgi:secreted Zn-dependent insulinase-like peptidase
MIPVASKEQAPADPEVGVARLGNGVRVVTLRLAHLDSVSVSVFVRTGSRNETRRTNGISHFVEHMAFKGTHERSCQQINLDAERLGAEVNAHTDKDHTAFHMHGMARDAGQLLRMLADVVQQSTFPEAELERERQVILQEYAEDEDDVLSTAYKVFDRLCFGAHAMARPVIGTRGNIERFTRADLLAHVQSQYSGANVVVGVAGNIDPDSIVQQAEAAFGRMVQGEENLVEAPAYLGGRVQPDACRARVPAARPEGRLPRRRARRRPLRRRDEFAAAGRTARAARPGLLRGLLGRCAGPVRPVRDRGIARARERPRVRGPGRAPAGRPCRAHRPGGAGPRTQPDRRAPPA